MKRRDFLRHSSIATTSPLFLDGFDFGVDLDGLTSGWFGNSNPDKDVPIKDRIGHAPPTVSITANEAEDGYTADVSVTDFNGWEMVNVYPMFDSATDQGGSQVSLDTSRTSATIPPGRENAPDVIPTDIDVAFEARYGRGSIYFGVAKYNSGSLKFQKAHEVPEYCWWDGWFSCRIDDPVPNEEMATPPQS